jgi:hypothetical protein
VWISNSYSTTGFNYDSYNISRYNGQKFNPDKDNQPVPTTPGSALQNVDFVGRGKLPSLYKANLAFDHELPWYGMVASAELRSPRSRMACTTST